MHLLSTCCVPGAMLSTYPELVWSSPRPSRDIQERNHMGLGPNPGSAVILGRNCPLSLFPFLICNTGKIISGYTKHICQHFDCF